METAQFGVGLAHYSSQVERPRSFQLVSRTSAIMKFGAGAGVDPFVKVKV